jgi:hypothetical protein
MKDLLPKEQVLCSIHDNFVVKQKLSSQEAYRQTRFYRNTDEGWLRIQPDDELWGAPRRLESSHFIWSFRQNDAQVIAAVAPQIDALYAELQRNFGFIPSSEKYASGAVTS